MALIQTIGLILGLALSNSLQFVIGATLVDYEKSAIQSLIQSCGGNEYWRSFFCGIDYLDCWDTFDLDICSLGFIQCSEDRTNIENLRLRGQGLDCELPEAIRELRNLKILDLSDNRIWGSIPLWLGDMVHLRQVHLGSNSLQGDMPFTISKLNQLQMLDVSRNGLNGTGLDSLCYLNNLEELDLSKNEIQGPMPACFTNMPGLKILHAEENKMHGPLPWNSIAGYRNNQTANPLLALTEVYLSANNFSGPIPSIFGFLSVLNASWNHFSGILSPRLAQVSVLDLSGNDFDCPLPHEFVDASFGNLSCTCQAGSYLNDDKLCLPCSAGSFSNETMQTSCTACMAGFYQPFTGSISCLKCADGTVSLENQTSCVPPCDLGQYWNRSECVFCEPGWYRNESSSIFCSNCAEGFESNSNRASCISCTPGYYRELLMPTCASCNSRPNVSEPLVYDASGNVACRPQNITNIATPSPTPINDDGDAKSEDCPSVSFGGECGMNWAGILIIVVVALLGSTIVVVGALLVIRNRKPRPGGSSAAADQLLSTTTPWSSSGGGDYGAGEVAGVSKTQTQAANTTKGFMIGGQKYNDDSAQCGNIPGPEITFPPSFQPPLQDHPRTQGYYDVYGNHYSGTHHHQDLV